MRILPSPLALSLPPENKAVGVMKPGHIFTIEPMINEGGYKDLLWPDGWTSVTTDGKLSAQFEHTILVTETGYEVSLFSLLTAFARIDANIPLTGPDCKDRELLRLSVDEEVIAHTASKAFVLVAFMVLFWLLLFPAYCLAAVSAATSIS